MASYDASPKNCPSVIAVIPAAGRSRRMGRAKQLLDLGGETMLEKVIAPLSQSRMIDKILLVTHSGLVGDLPLSIRCSCDILLNDDPATEMIDSVRLALRHIRGALNPAGVTGVLITPGDQPGLTVEDVDRCVAAYRERRGPILIASRNGRRGHPMIFPLSYGRYVFSAACDAGLRALPADHSEAVEALEIGSDAVIRNINTPEEYEELRDGEFSE